MADISDEQELLSGIARAFSVGNFKLKEVEKIMIKPNLCYYWDESTGQTTSPKIVGALIEYVRDVLDNDPDIIIGEADASAMRTRHVFRMLGYEKLAKEKGVRLLNLSQKPLREYTTEVQSKKIKLSFSKELVDSELIINVPKLKYHRVPKITCAMKNIFGAIAKRNKFSYHPNLSKIIVAANKIVGSDYILVDGLVALGNYPKIMKTILLGQDIMDVDSACSRIMGFNPRSVEYLKIAENEGLGKTKGHEITGDVSLLELRKAFPPADYWRQRIVWGLQLRMVDLYTKIVGDVVPPILLEP